MSARRGRPSGYTLNPDSFRGFLGKRPQSSIALSAGVSASHLSEMLSGAKGATDEVADRITAALETDDNRPLGPGAVFPERAQFKVAVREFTVSAA